MPDRYDYDRGYERDRDRPRTDYGRERARSDEDRYRDDRGFMDRAGDEVRSWFGDEEAARRRQRDEIREERHEYERGRERGFGSPDYPADRSRSSGYETDRPYSSGYSSGSTPRGEYRYGSERGYASGEDVRAGGIYGYRGSSYGGSMYGGSYRGGYSSAAERNWSGTSGRDWDRTSSAYGRGQTYDRDWDRPARGEWSERSYTGYSGWTEPGPYAGRGPRGYQRSDDRIREDICDRLTRHGRIDATDIQVSVSKGEVTLDGEVDSRDGKRLAEEVAESVDGVREVTNHLKTHRSRDDEHWQRQSSGQTTAGHEGVLGTPGAPSTLGLSGTDTRGAATPQSEKK